jgi:hypothetical protein
MIVHSDGSALPAEGVNELAAEDKLLAQGEGTQAHGEEFGRSIAAAKGANSGMVELPVRYSETRLADRRVEGVDESDEASEASPSQADLDHLQEIAPFVSLSDERIIVLDKILSAASEKFYSKKSPNSMGDVVVFHMGEKRFLRDLTVGELLSLFEKGARGDDAVKVRTYAKGISKIPGLASRKVGDLLNFSNPPESGIEVSNLEENFAIDMCDLLGFTPGAKSSHHGEVHVTHAALNVELVARFYGQLFDFKVTEEEVFLAKIAAIFHDCGRQGLDGIDIFDNLSAERASELLMGKFGEILTRRQIERICDAIGNKDAPIGGKDPVAIMLHEADSLEFVRFDTLNLRYLDAVNEVGNPLFKLRLANGMEESDAKAKLLLLANKAREISTIEFYSHSQDSTTPVQLSYGETHGMAFRSGLLEVSNGLYPYPTEFQPGSIQPTLPDIDNLEEIESFLESDRELSELFRHKNVFAISQHITAKPNDGNKIEALVTEIKEKLCDKEVIDVLAHGFLRVGNRILLTEKLQQTCLSLAGGEPMSDQDFAKLASALAKIREARQCNCSDTACDKILGIAKLCRMKDKIERTKVIADFCMALRADGFLENFAQKAAFHRCRMHEEGVFGVMPGKLEERDGYWPFGEGGYGFRANHIRIRLGQESITENLAKYVEQNGGSYNFWEIFGTAQYVSSHSPLAISVKTWLEKQRELEFQWNAFYKKDDKPWSPQKRARVEAGDKVMNSIMGKDFRESRNFGGPNGRKILQGEFSQQPKSYWKAEMLRLNELKFGLLTEETKEQYSVRKLSESLDKFEHGESVLRVDCERHDKVISKFMDNVWNQMSKLEENSPETAAAIVECKEVRIGFNRMKGVFEKIFDNNPVGADVLAKLKGGLVALGNFIGKINQHYSPKDHVKCFVNTLDQQCARDQEQQQGHSPMDESLYMLYAATQEMMHVTNLPGKDEDNEQITLYRRVDEGNFREVFTPDGEGSEIGQIAKAAAYDSCSAVKPAADDLSEWHGGHVLKIKTPLHRIFCTHLLGTLSEPGMSFLGSDSLHEFVTMCNGLSATASPNVDTQDSQV